MVFSKNFVIILFVGLLLVGSVSAASWYVDKDASGSNSGISWNDAWVLFGDIDWNLVQPGDTVYVSGGNSQKVYGEEVHDVSHTPYSYTFPVFAQGTANAPILIKPGVDAGHNGEVVFDAGTPGSVGGGIYISNTQHVLIEGFSINNYNSGIYIKENIPNEVNHVVLQNNNIVNAGHGGIAINGWSQGELQDNIQDVTIRNNHITPIGPTSAQTDLIYAQYYKNLIIEDNTLIQTNDWFNTNCQDSPHADPIQTNRGENVIIRRNYIEYNENNGCSLTMMLSWNIGETAIYDNIIHSYVPGPELGVKSILGNKAGAEPPFDGHEVLKIYNNVFIGDHYQTLNTDHATEYYVKNNIFYNLVDPSNNFETIAFFSQEPTSISNIDNNLYFGESDKAANLYWVGYPREKTVQEMRGYGAEINGMYANPLFVNFNNKDYHLQSTSPAIDAGTDLGSLYNTDKDGNLRTGAWDIGAYEYGGTGSSQDGYWYVDNQANGANDGTSWGNAWESFADIQWSVIQPGDIIYISGGSSSKTYTESLVVGKSAVTITRGLEMGHNGEPVLKAPVKRNGVGIGIYEKSDITISRLKIIDWFYAIEVDSFVLNGATNLRFEDNYIRGYETGIDFHGDSAEGDGRNLHDVWIVNNYIEMPVDGSKDNPDPAVDGQTDILSLYHIKNVYIIGNKFVNNNQRIGDTHNDFAQGEWVTNVYWIGNFIMNRNANLLYGANGVAGFNNPGGDFYFINNVVNMGTWSGQRAIWFNDRALAYPGNIHYSRNDNSKIRILGNTFITGTGRAIYWGFDPNGVIKNNLFWEIGTQNGNSYGHSGVISPNNVGGVWQFPVEDLNIEHNSFYYGITSPVYLKGDIVPPMPTSNSWLQYPDFAPSLVNFVPEPQSYTVNIYSQNPEDYALISSSVREIGSGGVLQQSDFPVHPDANIDLWHYIQRDFNGNLRTGSWDIGAFEYGGVPSGCSNGQTRSCSTGLLGVCSAGTQICSSGSWGVCVQNQQAAAEICDNGLDDDCDGVVDEGCSIANFQVGVLVEAEDGVIVSPMGVSGGVVSSSVDGSGTASYSFDVVEAGSYVLDVNMVTSGSGTNSFFVSLEGEEDVFDSAFPLSSEWDVVSWRGSGNEVVNEFDPMVFVLVPGVNTFVFRSRERGTGLDSLRLVSAGSCHPADDNCDGCIDLSEISAYVSLWLNGEVDLQDVSDAVVLWLSGC